MADAPPLRIIFLDIDGVICCNSMGRLEDKKMRILQGVAHAAQAKIVLSTDWRRIPQLKTQLIHALRSLGMDVIGATPCRPNWQAVLRTYVLAGSLASLTKLSLPHLGHFAGARAVDLT